MRLVFNLKPYTEFSGKGTKKDALNRLNYDYNMKIYRVPFEVMDALKIKMTQMRNGIKIEKR